jgi:hypothetical protein
MDLGKVNLITIKDNKSLVRIDIQSLYNSLYYVEVPSRINPDSTNNSFNISYKSIKRLQ